MKQTHFFLGANSAEGFYGLYDQLLDARLYDLIILKGTPGCGKSTFMRRAAAALEERGLETVYIHCSGDPDSLDGVIAPAIRTAIVDGTAPHGTVTLGHYISYLNNGVTAQKKLPAQLQTAKNRIIKGFSKEKNG